MSNKDKRIVNDVIDILGKSSAKIRGSASQYEADQHRRTAMASINGATARKESKLPILLVIGAIILISIFFIIPSGTPKNSLTLTDSSTNLNPHRVSPTSTTSHGCQPCSSLDNQNSQGVVSAQPETQVQECFLYNDKANYSRVNVRYYPDLDSEILGQYNDYTPVMINEDVSRKIADGYEWTEVTVVGPGVVGWAVSSKVHC